MANKSRRNLALASLIAGIGLALTLAVIAWKIQSPDDTEESPRELITLTREPLTDEVILRFLDAYPHFQKAQEQATSNLEGLDPIQSLQAQRQALKSLEQTLANHGWLPESFFFVGERIYCSLMVIDRKQLPKDAEPPLPATLEQVRKHRTKLIALDIRTP